MLTRYFRIDRGYGLNHHRINQIIESLSEDERIIMRVLARIEKTENNIFCRDVLARKKACFPIDLDFNIKSLIQKGLISPVKKDVWRTTSLGRRVEHNLEQEFFKERYGFRVLRGRP